MITGGKLLRSNVTPVLLDSANRAHPVDWDIIDDDFGLNFNISNPTAPSFDGGPALYNIYVNLAVGVGSNFAGEQVNLDLYINSVFVARDIQYTIADPPKIILFKIATLFMQSASVITAEVQLTYPFASNFFSGLVYVADSYLTVQKSTVVI